MFETKLSNYFKKSKIALLSIFVFLFLSSLSVLTYYRTIKDQKEAKLKQLEVAGNLTFLDFKKIVSHNIIALEDLRDRIVESNGEFKAYLASDTERIIRQNQAIKFIEYIDSTATISFVYPIDSNKAVLNLDIKKIEYRYPDWLANSKDTLTNITSWVDLTQHGKAFLVDVPIYYQENFQGTISAGMDFKEQFNNISSKQNLFSVLIKDNSGKIFYSFNNPKSDTFKANEIYIKNLDPVSKSNVGSWSFEFMFHSREELEATSLQNSILGLGIFLSLLIGLLSYFFLLAKRQSRQYGIINQKLISLNIDLENESIKAEKASQAKTQFLSNMSHEIRTPLSAILSISEILEGKNLSESEKEFLKLMQNSSKILLNLVNNILHIDKIETGKVELFMELFNPFSTLKKIVEIYTPAAKMKGIQIVTNFETVKDPKNVIGDVSRTEQIFTNLINNATKFTEEGKIEITYEEYEEDGKVNMKVIISDTGIGIDPSKIKDVFERFKQLDFGITKKHQGSGLGLAITKTLTELMNGKLELESKLGEGSTFTVSLEFAKAEHPQKNKKLTIYRDLSHLNVLVVDDNILNQKILVKILLKSNIKSDVSKDGDDALRKCASRHYDLIFMDVHMPGKDGFEIVKYLRKIDNTAVIFGFSADVTQEAIERGIKAGMNEYLTKPIEQEILFTALNKYFS